jgi:hypothetical protein
MDKAELFTDGEAYERMMGRWSRSQKTKTKAASDDRD